MARFVVTREPGPAWDPAVLTRDQDGWDAHAQFIDDLVDDGVVVLGGPLDGQRALLVMQHDDEDTLRAKLATDPWAGSVLATSLRNRGSSTNRSTP